MLIATLKNTNATSSTTSTKNHNKKKHANHEGNNNNNRIIVAFVDIDRRKDNFAEQIPLPYLSDLIVSQQYRNQVLQLPYYILSSTVYNCIVHIYMDTIYYNRCSCVVYLCIGFGKPSATLLPGSV